MRRKAKSLGPTSRLTEKPTAQRDRQQTAVEPRRTPSGGVSDRSQAIGNLARQREARLERSTTTPGPGSATRAVLSGPRTGEQLPGPLRTSFGTAFGQDLSGVRVHADTPASNAARELDAHAFAHGQHIYFAAGQYQPQTERGRHLLAHEVAHTVQQRASPMSGERTSPSSMAVSRPGDLLEREADRSANQALLGRSVSSISRASVTHPLLQRQPATATSNPPAVVVPAAVPPGLIPTGSPAAVSTTVPVARGGPPASAPSSATEIVVPPFKLFDAQEHTQKVLSLPILSLPLWSTVVGLPPPFFFATVGLVARVGLDIDLFLRYGPATIRDVRLSLDPKSHRYSGTARLFLPVAVGPRVKLTGSLTGSADLLGLIEAVAVVGSLRAIGQAPLIVALDPSIEVIYDAGALTFSVRPQIDAAVALIFDFNAAAEARLAKRKVWDKEWNLYHWQWGKAVRLGTKLSLDYDHGKIGPIRDEPYAERITIDELLAGLKDPAKKGSIVIVGPGGRPVRDRLNELLTSSGADPGVILATLAEADDVEKASILADPALKGTLEGAVGPALFPTAQRILANAPSVTVPTLDEGTVFLANRHIRVGRFQDALHVIVSRLQAKGFINGALATYVYTPDTSRGEGLTTTTYDVDHATGNRIPRGASQVQLFDPAFVNVPWLYSSIMHEYVHVLQFQTTVPAAVFVDPEWSLRREVEAYLWEIEHARGSGVIVSPQQMQEIGKRLRRLYSGLSVRSQKLYHDRYIAATTLVDNAVSGRLPVNVTYSIADARRVVQESSPLIADLIRKREHAKTPTEIAHIDAQVAKIQRDRSEALVEIVLAENPNVQIVDRARGIFRVPVVDGNNRVQWIFGGISVVWHLQMLSPSVFTVGAQIRSRPPATLPPGTHVSPHLLVGGSAIQSTVQPFPGDIDFAEEFEITAPTAAAAGNAMAAMVSDFVTRNASSKDLEFLRLRVLPQVKVPKKNYTWIRERILDPAQRAELADQLATITGGRVNTDWRALVAGDRFIDITKILAIHALSSVTGAELIKTQPSGAEFQEAYLDDAPPQLEPIQLAEYAALMRKLSLKEVADGNYLKAAKRAFNYFRTIGNLEAMNLITSVFATDQARISQHVAVLEAISSALDPDFPSRILTANIAKLRMNEAAALIETRLPPIPGKPGLPPATVAAELRSIAAAIQGDGGVPSGHMAPDRTLKAQLDLLLKTDIKPAINLSLEGQVKPIVDRYVR